MNRRALIIDVAKCINCNNCVLATKDEHVGNDYPGYAAAQPAQGHEWISIQQRVRGTGTQLDITYVPTMCNHCDDAPCIRAARDGSIYKRPDGVVIIDPEKARGRKDLLATCPYGAMAWNADMQLPQIWIFDAHLLDNGWTEPRCVQACPTGAMESFCGPDATLEARRAEEHLTELRPELRTRPRVLYRNLERTKLAFLSGSVCCRDAQGRLENVEGAHVELAIEGDVKRTATTDIFGDFRLDDMPAIGRPYVVRIQHASHGQAHANGTLTASQNLGLIELMPER